MKIKTKVISCLTIFFYLFFLFVWFKDNFYFLRETLFPLFIPSIPLFILIAIKIFQKGKRLLKIKLKLDSQAWTIILILLLAFLLRLPFLFYNFSLLSSDDAVMGLMGKHISEGRVPPISFYGQYRLGSLLAHFFALMFKIFGYSILIMKLSSLLFYLGFILIQFFLIKEISNFELAILGSLFFCFPIGDLIPISLDSSAGFSLVLFLGSLILYLTYLICYKNKFNLVPHLGFLIGLAFWSHQINIYFILTSLIFIILKFKIKIKKYLIIASYAIIGCFPFVLHELLTRFTTSSYLFGGKKFIFSFFKFKWFIRSIGYLLSKNYNILDIIFLILFITSISIIFILSIHKKKLFPFNLYFIFLLIFMFIYFSSGYSNLYIVRYLYPLYFIFPFFIFFPFSIISFKKKWFKYLIYCIILLIILVPSNFSNYSNQIKKARKDNYKLNRLIKYLEETKEKYWLSDYWLAYLITALTKERFIIASYTVKRYLPYQLIYYNKREKTNFLFSLDNKLGRYNSLILQIFLKRNHIEFKRKKFHKFLLIYDINYLISPKLIVRPFPKTLPELVPEKIIKSDKIWRVIFKIKNSPPGDGFRANLNIPGMDSSYSPIFPYEKKVEINIPPIQKNKEEIFYFLDYYGIPLKNTFKKFKETKFQSLSMKIDQKILSYKGLSPALDFEGEKVYLCSKNVQFKILKKNLSKIILKLYSPFNFKSQFWYGNYHQYCSIYLDTHFIGNFKLNDGWNEIIIDPAKFNLKNCENLLTLKFKFTLPFNFPPIKGYEVSALLSIPF